MSDFTRREVRRLKPELKYVLREALRKRDLSGLIAWLHKYGNHLSLERQAQMVAECREIINDESGGRKR
jgi:hypothetical protein